jgi:hemolysin III
MFARGLPGFTSRASAAVTHPATLVFVVCCGFRAVSEVLTSQRLRFSFPLGLYGPGWIRTSGLGIKSPLLYQLSYRPSRASFRMPDMDELQKPLLRGIFHQYAFVCAIAAGIVLVALADGGRELVATWVYAAALAAMFGASALYHRVDWRSGRVRAWMRRLDHSMIFVFIAGSYTPFALLAFHGPLATAVLVTVWAAAAVGLLLNVVWIDAPRWVAAIVYLAVGWVGVMALPQLFSEAGVAPAVLVIVGGGLYTLGALAYAAHRPNPWPAVFGFHEIFHLFVIGAAVSQYIAISFVVV